MSELENKIDVNTCIEAVSSAGTTFYENLPDDLKGRSFIVCMFPETSEVMVEGSPSLPSSKPVLTSKEKKALKKALASIGDLEGGFSTMLRKDDPPIQPAPQPVTVNPQAFEGKPRDMLLEIGASCRQVARLLSSTAQHLQKTAATDLTLADYQRLYAEIIPPLQSTQTLLLKHLALLRLELASEELPLVLWRVHDQVQAIAESLRWGSVEI